MNQENKTVNRNGVIDIYRLLFALIIMAGHSVTLGMQSPFPFEGVGMFVEFFFLLTGYYTCMHFDRQKQKDSSEWIAAALPYTWKKFSAFLPCLCVSVSLRYLLDVIAILRSGGGIWEAAKSALYMPFEVLMMNYLTTAVPQKVGALWFLSACLVVFPLICVLCQCRNHTVRLGIALYAMLFYYYDPVAAVTADYPAVLFRAFSGMCMGITVFYAVMGIRIVKPQLHTAAANLLFLCGNLCLLASMLISGLKIDSKRFELIFIYFGSVILLSDISPLSKIHNQFTDYISRLSMSVYIIHWTAGCWIGYLLPEKQMIVKMSLYYAVTIVVSHILLWAVQRKRQLHLQYPAAHRH